MDEAGAGEYQLRRIGKPATLAKVKDVFRLTNPVTRFGRHSGNDQFLDSEVLNNFISRWHAEIHRQEQNGKVCFVLQDNSLNGTYVNHTRVKGSCVLSDGDIVLFGHKNGRHIKPGQRAVQVDSEFKFVFEEVKPPPADIYIDLSTDADQVAGTPVTPTIPLTGETGNGQDMSNSQAARQAVVNRRILPITDGKSIVLKDISNTGAQSQQGLVPLETLINSNCVVQNHETSDHVGDLVAHVSMGNSVTTMVEHGEVTSSTASMSVATLGTSSGLSPFTTLQVPDSTVEMSTREEDLSEELTTPAENSSLASSVLHTPQAAQHLANMPPSSSASSRSNKTTTKRGGVGGGGGGRGGMGRGAGGGKRMPGTTTNVRRRDSNTSVESMGKKRKKTAATNKKMLQAKAAKKSKFDFTDDEEDEDWYSWHTDGDTCAARRCTRPAGLKVDWVQCDDCDEWYHTLCAGCSYKVVKDEDAEFHCGCK